MPVTVYNGNGLDKPNKNKSIYLGTVHEILKGGTVLKAYLSAQEAADKWGVSIRWVNKYLNDGRILGAERLGRVWAIPEGAEKPEKQKSGPKPKYM